jgi:hypothetical protein
MCSRRPAGPMGPCCPCWSIATVGRLYQTSLFVVLIGLEEWQGGGGSTDVANASLRRMQLSSTQGGEVNGRHNTRLRSPNVEMILAQSWMTTMGLERCRGTTLCQLAGCGRVEGVKASKAVNRSGSQCLMAKDCLELEAMARVKDRVGCSRKPEGVKERVTLSWMLFPVGGCRNRQKG